MNNENEIKDLLTQNLELSQKIYRSAERSRKYFLWSLIIGLAMIIIPLALALIFLPSIIGNYLKAYQGLL